jgi:2-phosphosulfolactate phosphatase
MPPRLNVFALPQFADPKELVDGAVVVIDVLRASTTIIYALEAGANEVIPCREVAEARSIARNFPSEEVVLGGERDGVHIEGFDLGNSPEEYEPHLVGGKTIVFTTTNGTQALLHAKNAKQIYIGAFVNVSAVVQKLLGEDKIHLLCAGTEGQFGEDDILFAGMLTERLSRQGGMPYELNAQAITAREMWLHQFALPQALGAEPLEPERLAKPLQQSLGGKNLVALGLEDDILAAAQIDRFQCVPRFDPKTCRIQ